MSHACIQMLALATMLALAACTPKTEPAADAPAAPAAGTAAPRGEDVRAFRIGELDAFALRDGTLEFPNDNKVFGVGLAPGDVAAVLAANGMPTDKVQLSLQPLLVQAGERVLLFDTGAAGLFGPTLGKLPASLAAAGVEPASVTDIFISHSHGDHIGGLVNAEGGLAFPNAAIHIPAPEWEAFSADKDMAAIVAAITPKVVAFAPGVELVPGVVTAVRIDGHTPGHSGYRIASGAESLLYVGDAAHSAIISVQEPEWHISFDGDPDTGAASRKALIEANAASGQRIYAVHFPFPGLGRFEKRGEGYAWVAE